MGGNLMWLKIAGCLVLITAGALWGFNMAARYQWRPQQIRQLINGIAALKSYIRYASTPLAEAFKQSAQGLSGTIKQVFITTADEMAAKAALTPAAAIDEALTIHNPSLTLRHQEREALILFGAKLGQMNRDEQEQHCDLLLVQLEQIEREALNLRDQNVNMYRYLGVCGGLAAVILLL